jgi:hypothetical protein
MVIVSAPGGVDPIIGNGRATKYGLRVSGFGFRVNEGRIVLSIQY